MAGQGVTLAQINQLNQTPPVKVSPALTSAQVKAFINGTPTAPSIVNNLHPFVMCKDRTTGYQVGNPYATTGNLQQTSGCYYPGNPPSGSASTLSPCSTGTNTDEFPTDNITTTTAGGVQFISGGHTNPGMPYLPIIDAQNLTYDLPNGYYGQGAPSGYTKPPLAAIGAAPSAGKLGPHETAMEVGILPHLGLCSTGSPALGASYQIDLSNNGAYTGSFTVGSTSFFQSTVGGGTNTWTANVAVPYLTGNQAELVRGQYSQSSTGYETGYWESNLMAADNAGRNFSFYSSTYVIVGDNVAAGGGSNGGTFAFGGLQLPVGISYVVTKHGASRSTGAIPTPTQFPTWVAFPAASFPTPKLPQCDSLGNGPGITTFLSGSTYPANVIIPATIHTIGRYTLTTKNDMVDSYWNGGLNASSLFTIIPEGFFQGDTTSTSNPLDYIPCDTFRTVECAYGDNRLACNAGTTQSNQSLANVAPGSYNNLFLPQANYFNALDPTTSSYYLRGGFCLRGVQAYSRGALPGNVLRPDNDLVLTLPQTGGKTTIGIFPKYNESISSPSFPLGLDNSVKGHGMDAPDLASTFDVTSTSTPVAHGGDVGNFYKNVWSLHCDFDNNIGSIVPAINMADEGDVTVYNQYAQQNPYYAPSSMMPGVNLSCPNRQVPSAVCFGSLPSGIDPNNPSPTAAWKTLQFSPNPNRSATPGADRVSTPLTPPDYLLLDLFQMPVVKPYAISGTFYTSGKVNMNYQMAPFNYIVRNTALRGVLKGVAISAVQDSYAGGNEPLGFGAVYNGATVNNNGTQVSGYDTNYDAWVATTGNLGFYYPIHLGETLKQFDYRYFDQNDTFHSPSEICSLWLYPATQPTSANRANPATSLVSWDTTSSKIKSWWYDNPGTSRKFDTGDNMRERPYGDLLAKLTTQSNTYTVHYRVQFLKKSNSSPASSWVEPTPGSTTPGQDMILGEYRGSSLIERYLDSNASGGTAIPDVAPTSFPSGTTGSTNLDTYYKFRVVANRHFAP